MSPNISIIYLQSYQKYIYLEDNDREQSYFSLQNQMVKLKVCFVFIIIILQKIELPTETKKQRFGIILTTFKKSLPTLCSNRKM